MIYLDGRGLRKYDHGHLTSFDGLKQSGRAARDRLRGELATRRAALDYDEHLRDALYIRHHRAVPRAWC